MSEKLFYLIPTSLGADNFSSQFPLLNHTVLETIELIWVENPKPARAFIKACNLSRPIQDFDLRDIPKVDDTILNTIEIEKSLMGKTKVGFMSDAGLPCIADPGAIFVNIARKLGFKIIPLVGPSSITLGLMASGMNGQQFVFHGYLPIQPVELKKAIKSMESEVLGAGYTQIFIETPYRNDKLLPFLLQNLHNKIRLCIGINLLQNDQEIHTKTIEDWSKDMPEIGKRPAVYLIGK